MDELLSLLRQAFPTRRRALAGFARLTVSRLVDRSEPDEEWWQQTRCWELTGDAVRSYDVLGTIVGASQTERYAGDRARWATELREALSHGDARLSVEKRT